MKRSPRGFTLIEMLLAMVLFSTVLTVVAVALGGLARADRKSRDRIDRQRSLQRFVVRLRRDIHEASSATISPVEAIPLDANADEDLSTRKQTFTLARDDGRTIHFQPTDDGIVRTVMADDTLQHREFYSWGSQSVAAWSMDTTQELPMAILALSIDGGAERTAEQHVVQATLLNSQSNTEE